MPGRRCWLRWIEGDSVAAPGGKAHGFLGGAQQRARLVPALLVLRLRLAVSDQTGAGLDVHGAVLHHRRAQRDAGVHRAAGARSEEHTSELQSLMRISYAVFCLKKKIKKQKL